MTASERAARRRELWQWLGGWMRSVAQTAWRSSRWGLAICAALWLIVCLVPPLRYALRAQVVGSGVSNTYNENQWPWTKKFEGRTWSFRRLAALYPNDVRVLAQVPNEDPNAFDDGDDSNSEPIPIVPPRRASAMNAEARKVLIQYDELIRRFPNRAWLLAMRLNRARTEMRDGRFSVSSNYSSRLYSSGYRGDGGEANVAKPNYTDADMQEALRVAQRGGALEPDNAYWDWMRASFLFSARRDDECFGALSQAARKPRFDDHYLDILRARLEALERVRPLLLEEKIGVSAPDTDADRVGSSFVNGLTPLLRAWWKGDKGFRALSIQGDLARIAALRLSGRSPLYNGGEGSIWLTSIWEVTPNLWATPRETAALNRLPYREQGAARLKLKAQQFARVARRNGRPDIADATPAQAQTALRRWKKGSEYYRWRPGVATNLRARNLTLWWLGTAMLLQMALSAFLWCVLSLLLLCSRPHSDLSAPWWRSRTAFVVTANALVGLALIAVALRGDFGQLFVSDLLNGVQKTPEQTRRVYWVYAAMIAAFTLWPASALFSAWFAWLSSVWAVWRGRKVLCAPEKPRYDGESARIVPPNPLPWIDAFITWGIVSYLVAAWLGALVAYLTDAKKWYVPLAWFSRDIWVDFEPLPLCLIVAISGTFFCWFAWPFKWRFTASQRWRPRAHATLHLYRRALGWSLTVATVFYFALALGRLSVERAGLRAYDLYLQRGEIALLTQR